MKLLNTLLLLIVVHLAFGQGAFVNKGTLKLATGTQLGFFGDVINNGIVMDSADVVIIAGISAQEISGDSIIAFNNLQLENSSVGGVQLAQNVEIKNSITFINGLLHTSADSLLILLNNATSSGGDTSSYVDGPVAKIGNQAFEFPVGKNGQYAPIGISAPSDTTDRFLGEYFGSNPDASYSINSKEPTVGDVSNCEYWTLDRTIGSAAVYVTLSWENNTRSCVVGTPAETQVVRWNGTEWANHGNGSYNGNTTSGEVTSSNTVTSFSPFAIASEGVGLPITLLYLRGSCTNNLHFIEWSTEVEVDNAQFIVEQSTDGVNWLEIGAIEGAGNSTQQQLYSFECRPIPRKNSYYRLKSVDFNHQATYSAIISVAQCPSQTQSLEISVHPNPAVSYTNIAYNGDSTNLERVLVTNLAGQLVAEHQGAPTTLETDKLSKGSYLLHFIGPGVYQVKRLVVW